MHAVAVAHPVHVVIGTNSRAYQSPGRDRFCGAGRESLMYLLSVYHTFARLRKQDDTFGMRGGIVFHFFHKERQRVNIVSRCRLNHIQMQVRAERVARIAAKGYHLPCLYRIISTSQLSFSYCKAFTLRAISPTNALRWRLIVE